MANPELPDWIRDHGRRHLATDGADGQPCDANQRRSAREIPVVVLERLA